MEDQGIKAGDTLQLVADKTQAEEQKKLRQKLWSKGEDPLIVAQSKLPGTLLKELQQSPSTTTLVNIINLLNYSQLWLESFASENGLQILFNNLNKDAKVRSVSRIAGRILCVAILFPVVTNEKKKKKQTKKDMLPRKIFKSF